MKNQHTILELGSGQEEETGIRWLWKRPKTGARVQIAGLGDVGGMVLTGLFLNGSGTIRSVGIYDKNENLTARWEMEMQQTAVPFAHRLFPEIYCINEKQLFDCDVFVFCVAVSVPAPGKEQGDVRMAQLEANAKIISHYARMAADRGFCGLFLVVSDPVDLLCKAALLASREGRRPMNPAQIQGCGLGVMNGRALYYAARDERFACYSKEGRVFGPHGKDLVAANSILPEHYNEEDSLRLTRLTVNANSEIRNLGFKPYIAPALSSGVFTILLILRGEWNYSSNYLGGVYFGARNRRLMRGICWETEPLPDALYERLEAAWKNLSKIL